MLCGCSSGRKKDKKSADDLSYYGQPAPQKSAPQPDHVGRSRPSRKPRQPRQHRQCVDRRPLVSKAVPLRCDQEYPSSNNPLVSDIDPDRLSDPDEELLRKHSVPILEFCEKEAENSQMQLRKMYQPYKGQLNVSVYVNYGLLTVNIIEGRDLSNALFHKPATHVYVRVSLLPDDIGRSHCKTKLSTDLEDPVFKEKFSFELLDEDSEKRVLISVWRKKQDRRETELVGCMSFGIKNILQKSEGACGWYYLLSEYIGKRKHLHAKLDKNTLVRQQGITDLHNNNTGSRSSSRTRKGERAKITEDTFTTPEKPDQNTSSLESTLLGSDDSGYDSSHLIEMKTSNQGCGLTLTGGCPARVFVVEPGSAAELAGLKPEDCVISVNHVSVARCTAETVARIVRNCEGVVRLEIGHSKRNPQPLESVPKHHSIARSAPHNRAITTWEH